MSELLVARVLAPNPGPFTLEGTNTWVVGSGPVLVIDPGPDDPRHLEAVLERAGSIEAILLTHHHPDHAPGASRLGQMAAAPVMAASPAGRERALEDGMAVDAAGVSLRVVAAPGHTPDHLVFFARDARALFTGDAVLGRGTSVIDPPEGDLAAYLGSLRAMQDLGPRVIYPGHGPVVTDPATTLREYVEHRRQREEQVLAALRDGARTPEEMVPSIYAGYPAELFPAAARSVLAHLIKLEQEGLVARATSSIDRFTLVEGSGIT